MRALGCDSCLTVVRLVGDPIESQRLIFGHPRWKDGFPCIYTDCPGPMKPVDEEMQANLSEMAEGGLIRIKELTSEEMFRALCGFGTPDEVGCEPEVVIALLKSTKISGAIVRRSPSGRAILDRLDLDNGLSLHLASSARGPTVFKVTRRRDEAEDDHGGVLEDSPRDHLPGEDERGRGGAQRGGPPRGRPLEVDGQQHVHGGDHRGAAPHAPEASGREGDDDPGTREGADLQAAVEGVRAGPEDGGSDPGRPGEGQGDVQTDRAHGDREAAQGGAPA